jgi:hypothetical protein
MDIGALGNRDERDAAVRDVERRAGVGINPGTKNHVRLKVSEGVLQIAADGGCHEQVIYRAADLREVGRGYPAGAQRSIFRPGRKILAIPRENGARRQGADLEMRFERVKYSRVIQATVGLSYRGEEIRQE